ncbi:MAG: hypothetical protein AAF206_02200 [Bacteroidota bacterium]
MTVEQQEQHILALLYKLPILRRLRLALMVLQGIEPETVSLNPVDWETPEFFNELDRRHDDMVSGKDPGVSAEKLFNKIDTELG